MTAPHIRALRRTEQGELHDLPDAETIGQHLASQGGVIWVDIFDPDNGAQTQVERLLSETFKFHPLAVEDALVESHLPKVDDWGEYLYVVLHAVAFDADLSHVRTYELDIFIGRQYLVTYRSDPIPALEDIWRKAHQDDRLLRFGMDHLLYRLCDAIASSYLPCMDQVDEVIDGLQTQVLHSPSPRLAERIFQLKAAVLTLRRVLAPQREVMSKLARGDSQVIDSKDRAYFRDVYDHFVRLTDLNESLRDLVSGLLDIYLSVVANRTNEVMKTLTAASLLFLPLTFVTGVFGMNFFGGSIELSFDVPKWVFFFGSMGLMALIPVSMLLYIRWRGWL
ncbi:MAG: magnesium/cobalt transporter CorA [Anaerolineae bacterium]|nr:magnesium/cobalt transporter CorA [Thermoflexales bacterium]MDW8394923.1 magnesium/cobalt transporter CorA [Anaerolineae bacterium]